MEQDLGHWYDLFGILLMFGLFVGLRLRSKEFKGKTVKEQVKSFPDQTQRKAANDAREVREQEQRAEYEEAQRAREIFHARQGVGAQYEAEWSEYVKRPIEPDIVVSMESFLSGDFVGEDRSPLAYVGYQVGKTQGLPEIDRHRRLEVCFRVEVPTCLSPKYQSWGRPATVKRLKAMQDHLSMLANMRRGRKSYHFAVSEWEADANWLRMEFTQKARKFSGLSFKDRAEPNKRAKRTH